MHNLKHVADFAVSSVEQLRPHLAIFCGKSKNFSSAQNITDRQQ